MSQAPRAGTSVQELQHVYEEADRHRPHQHLLPWKPDPERRSRRRLVGSFIATAWLLTYHFTDAIFGARAWEQPGQQIDNHRQKN